MFFLANCSDSNLFSTTYDNKPASPPHLQLPGKSIGRQTAIILRLLICVGTLGYIYGFLHSVLQFFILGGMIAEVRGGKPFALFADDSER